MWGKKPRLYYHGMPRMCLGCFSLGHLKHECTKPQKSWGDYVEILRSAGVPSELFGTWLTTNITPRPIHDISPAPALAPGQVSTPVVDQAQFQAFLQFQQLLQSQGTATPNFTPNTRGRGGRSRARTTINLAYTPTPRNNQSQIPQDSQPSSSRGRGGRGGNQSNYRGNFRGNSNRGTFRGNYRGNKRGQY